MRGRSIGRWAALATVLAAAGAPAGAETLREALLKAYASNPTITGQRAAQRATDENVPIARAAGLPSANATGTYTENALQATNSFLNPARFANATAGVSIPLYQGGAVRNGVRAAETRVEAGRATLRNTEANLFTNTVAAYMNVIRDEAIVSLNTQNVRVLDTNLRASRDRFQVGDLTRTDVAQSEARLSLARAQLQSAEAQLIASREDYINVVGSPPDRLEQPPLMRILGEQRAIGGMHAGGHRRLVVLENGVVRQLRHDSDEVHGGSRNAALWLLLDVAERQLNITMAAENGSQVNTRRLGSQTCSGGCNANGGTGA